MPLPPRRATPASHLTRGLLAFALSAQAAIAHPARATEAQSFRTAQGAAQIRRDSGERLPGTVSAADFGMRCDGTPGVDGPALQAALDTGQNVYAPRLQGRCELSATTLTMTTPAQRLYGDGEGATIFVVASPTAGSGTFVLAGGTDARPAPTIDSLSVFFQQPDVRCVSAGTDDLGQPCPGMRHYPPAIDARRANFLRLSHLGIFGAWDAIDAGGNFTPGHVTGRSFLKGWAELSDIQVQAWHRGILIEGYSDWFHLSRFHWWGHSDQPDGGTNHGQLSDNKYRAWFGQGPDRPIGLQAFRCDGLWLDHDLFIGGLGVHLAQPTDPETGSPIAGPFVAATDSDLDTLAGLVMDAGSLTWTGGVISAGNPLGDTRTVVVNGGDATFANVAINHFADPSHPTFDVRGGTLGLAGGRFLLNRLDVTAVENEGGQVTIRGVSFRHDAKDDAGTHYKLPVLHQGSRGSMRAWENAMDDLPKSFGVFVQLDSENGHRVTGNDVPGYAVMCPNGEQHLLASRRTSAAPLAICPELSPSSGGSIVSDR